MADTVDPHTGYLNLSFGTYGCTALHDVTKEMEPQYLPLGIQTVLLKLHDLGTDVSATEMFAASGNDFLGPNGPYPNDTSISYPAGWGPDYEWLHSVASDPKSPAGAPSTSTPPSATDTRTAIEDYSNRGPWVETQARGSNAVSLLPNTNSWGPEHWAKWSGTSFATPCALAKFVEKVANPAADYFEQSGPNAGGIDPAGRYLECGVNLP